MDTVTQRKWDEAAQLFDIMCGVGAEKRWEPVKRDFFGHMEGKILFLALGTGLDIATFPEGKEITAIDIAIDFVMNLPIEFQTKRLRRF